jgi:RNA polymerase sigma-70 factor (ECF subfamily)
MALEPGGYVPEKGSKKEEKQASGGQEEGFLKAFDEYVDPLFRHASIRLSNRERAIEIVHDTFAKVWGYLREGHVVVSFRPFLYKVLNNLIIDEYRRGKETSLDAILEQEGVDEGSFAELRDEPVERMINVLDAQEALVVLRELPEMYQRPIVLRFVDGLAPKEIAELIEESENVVSVRIHRGIGFLKKKLEARHDRSRNQDRDKDQDNVQNNL